MIIDFFQQQVRAALIWSVLLIGFQILVHGQESAIAQNLLTDTLQTAQEPEQRTAWNAAYYEFLGSGLSMTLNYERLLPFGGLALRVGAVVSHTIPLFGEPTEAKYVIALTSSVQLWQSNSYVELGGSYLKAHSTFNRITPILGYRYCAKQGGLFVRVTYTPALYYYYDNGIIQYYDIKPIWFGMSIGWSF